MGEWLAHPLRNLHSRREQRQVMQIIHGDGVSRRLLLRRGARIGAGLTVGAGLLAACDFPQSAGIDLGEPLSGDEAADPVSKTFSRLNTELQKNQAAKKLGETSGNTLVINQVTLYEHNGSRKKITVHYSESDPSVVTAVEMVVTAFNRNLDNPTDTYSGIVGQRRARLSFDTTDGSSQATLISQYTVRVTDASSDRLLQFTDRYAANPSALTKPLEFALDQDSIDPQHPPAPIDVMPNNVALAPLNNNALYIFESRTKEAIDSLA